MVLCSGIYSSHCFRSIVPITHAPVQEIKGLVKFAKRNGAKIVIVHGETIAEPVIPGTNRKAIEAGCDILAHPGLITDSDVEFAKARGVCLEITTRKNHSRTNKRLFKIAKRVGAKLVLDNDAHSDENLATRAKAIRILRSLGMTQPDINQVFKNSSDIVRKKS